MIALDEKSLICDFAETYGVLDYKGLQPKKAAVLACGLRPNSRIKMKLSRQAYTEDTLLLAIIADRLSFLAWAKTKDAQKNRNRPKSIYEMLTAAKETNEKAFGSIEDFEAARAQFFGEE